MAKDELFWRTLSEDLRAVVRAQGPVPLGEVSALYQAMHGQPFNLGGYKLRDCLREEGKLLGAGLRIDWSAGTLVKMQRKKGAGVSTAATAASTTRARLGTALSSATSPAISFPREPLASYRLIDSVQSFNLAFTAMSPDPEFLCLWHICEGRAIAVELEGEGLGTEEGQLSLVKIAGSWSGSKAVIFDVVALERTASGMALLREELYPIFEDESSTKVVHGFNSGAVALRRHFGIDLKGYLLDTQLAMELLLGDVHADVDSVFKAFAGDHDPDSDAPNRAVSSRDVTADASRPIGAGALGRAARSITSLAKAGEAILETGLDDEQRKQLLLASKMKIDNAISVLDGATRMTFRDQGSCSGGGVGRVMISRELKEVQEKTFACTSSKNMDVPDISRPPLGDGHCGSSSTGMKPVEEEDVNYMTDIYVKSKRYTKSSVGRMKPVEEEDVNSPLEVLKLIPDVFLEEHLSTRQTENLKDLQDIMLDEGRRPKALLQGRGNVFLCSDPNIVVTAKHIDNVVGRLELDGKFGDDNRAGFPNQLHRVSVLRRKQERKIIGVTLRIGRFFKGSAGLIDDLLFPPADSPGKPQRAPSILVLGVPGSGKTTAIRDICSKISATQSVMIVDTSNEIAGDGDIPHRAAIGESRRIMVPNKKEQHRVMTEALQNHTPRTIVVDEISDEKEACACLDIKERGVRMVASAHGDFRSLLKSPKLNTLVGGKTSVTVGDTMAMAKGGNKVQTQRAGAPIFETVIELKRGDVNEWTIIKDVGAAVDAVLSGHSYKVERRTRLKDDSQIEHEDSNSENVTFRLSHAKEAKIIQ